VRVICFIAVLMACAAARADDRAAKPALTLTVSVNRPSAPFWEHVFQTGEIHFAAELTNRTTGDVRIDGDFDDLVRFTLRCDGQELLPTWRYAPPIVSRLGLPSMRVLKHGESVSFTIQGVFSQDRQHGDGFATYQPRAGVCVIRFTYETPGIAPVQSNNVVFELLAPGEKSRILPQRR
jgi:hypothetical protein